MGLFINNEEDELRVGDNIRIIKNKKKGFIISKNQNMYTVSLEDGLIDSYEAHELEKCW